MRVLTLGVDPGDQITSDFEFYMYSNDDGSDYWQCVPLGSEAMKGLMSLLIDNGISDFYVEALDQFKDIVVIDLTNSDGDREHVLGALDNLFARAENNITLTEPFRIPTSKATFITWKESE